MRSIGSGPQELPLWTNPLRKRSRIEAGFVLVKRFLTLLSSNRWGVISRTAEDAC